MAASQCVCVSTVSGVTVITGMGDWVHACTQILPLHSGWKPQTSFTLDALPIATDFISS